MGKQLKARRHTRNHGNKYASWALAYVAKNRVNTVHFTDNSMKPALDLDPSIFLLSDVEKIKIRERLVNMVQRIMVKYLPMFEPLDYLVQKHIQHTYSVESATKSEIVSINYVIHRVCIINIEIIYFRELII